MDSEELELFRARGLVEVRIISAGATAAQGFSDDQFARLPVEVVHDDIVNWIGGPP